MASYRLWLHPLHRRKSRSPLRIDEMQRATSHDERIAVLREVCCEASTHRVDVAQLTEVVVRPDALVARSEECGSLMRLPLRLSQVCEYDILETPEGPSDSLVGVVAYAYPMAAFTARGEECEALERIQGDVWLLIVTDGVPCASHSIPNSAVLSQAMNALTGRGAISGDTSAFEIMDERTTKGGFGTVHFFQRKHDVNDSIYAGKLLDDQAMSACAECDYLLAARSHPNIVAFLGIFCFWTSSQERRWMIVTEGHLGGDLGSRVRRCGAFPDREALQVSEGVLKAVSHLHEHDIIHRDVKPANVVIASDGRAVLIDLGLAVHVSESARRKRTCGTPGFTAPEIMHRRGCQFKSDVFGCGALLYFAASGIAPFVGSSKKETLKLNARAHVNFDDPLFLLIPPHTIELIHSMLQKKPRRRPTARSVCKAITLVIEMIPPVAWPVETSHALGHVSKSAMSPDQASSSTWEGQWNYSRDFSSLETADVLNSFPSISSMSSSARSSVCESGSEQDVVVSKKNFFSHARAVLGRARQMKRQEQK